MGIFSMLHVHEARDAFPSSNGSGATLAYHKKALQ